VIHATTRLVQVSVIAQDKHGQPIADMKREDFRLFDNGKEQQISFFSMESAHVAPVEHAELPPDTWTNRYEGRSAAPVNVTLILFDGLNTHVWDQEYARQQLVRFLSQLNPEDRVAIYTLGRQLRVLHDFTRDASSLLRALSHYKGYNGPEVAASQPDDPDTGSDAFNAFLSNADELTAQYAQIDRAIRTADALEAIAGHVAAIPGRKSLIWFSGGFPFTMGYGGIPVLGRDAALQDRNFMDEVQRAARALNDANVAVYPVDAKGLLAPASASATTRVPRGGVPGRRAPSNLPIQRTDEQSAIDTMNELAGRTGGRAFYHTNDFAGAIRRAIDDSRVIYTLAYTPAHNEWNGKFRQIKVESRRSGVQLRHRSGYFALPDEPLDATQRDQMLVQAQWSPLDATGIRFTVHTASGSLDGKPAVVLTLIVDPADLRFTEQAGRHSVDLLLGTAQHAENSRVVQGEKSAITLRLKDETYQKILANGLKVTSSTVLDPAATRLRIVLLDTGSGRMGSVNVPLPGKSSASAPAAPRAAEKPKP
jgi:VWFA-related protein